MEQQQVGQSNDVPSSSAPPPHGWPPLLPLSPQHKLNQHRCINGNHGLLQMPLHLLCLSPHWAALQQTSLLSKEDGLS